MGNIPVKGDAIDLNPSFKHDAFSVEDNNGIMKIIHDSEDVEEWIVRIIDEEFWNLLA